MDKFISAVKAIQAIAGVLISYFGGGMDFHNPVSYIGLVVAIEGSLNAIFHWHNQ